jgi:prepilin-type N-terminal cleavage/methylation domain-containing protein
VSIGRRAQDADGFSLIELLIAIVVLGVGVVAVVSAMSTTIIVVDVHRSLSAGETVTRNYVDAVKAKALAATTYTKCPSIADVTPTFSAGGYSASVSGVEYWLPDVNNPLTGSYVTQAACVTAYQSRCAGLPSPLPAFCDTTVQRVSISVSTALGAKSGAADTSTKPQTSRIVIRRGNA